ncbi:CDP-archaeol synthase [Candidatus Methylocalor cossyra]|uniref:Integral membrane protein DUF46 n=1 Tax=Candidatus Methylocalor cossyra TaxID=3108543 RepID=A0ABM9NJ44_9GAMM
MLTLKLLFLLSVANGAPIVLKKLLGNRGDWPLDGGWRGRDGRPLLGPSKTWRGCAAALLATGAAALALGWPFALGLLIGITAMVGDLASSFVKRRLGIPSSGKAPGLDQIPESLLPLLAVRCQLGLGSAQIALLVASFVLLDVVLSRLLYALHIREQPH